MIDSFMKENKISPLNTRLVKVDDVFEIKLASTSHTLQKDLPYLKEHSYEGKKIRITRGDFSFCMEEIVNNLRLARRYAANDVQREMLDQYILNFDSGDMEYHKEAMKKWITDVGPAIETNIGYIETYLDPLGVRAEYEGLVALVNKEVSKMFNKLVEKAEELILELPWDREFEKDKFNKPDFTSLNVLAFACSGTPIGINLPNYDDIRQTLGYKNVDLSNAYPKPRYENIQYMHSNMKDTYFKYSHDSLTLMVALHELLGHGTGKLLTKNVDTGDFNFDPQKVKNPFTGEEITTFYLSTETWSSKFGKLHSGYEECRADTVALYLAHFKKPYEIFFTGREDEWEDIEYVMWLDTIRGALLGLQYYDENTKTWGQAHIVAGYVSRFLLNYSFSHEGPT
jgi:dipeptidyl-peptidase III